MSKNQHRKVIKVNAKVTGILSELALTFQSRIF
jgi:hypothetical protein